MTMHYGSWVVIFVMALMVFGWTPRSRGETAEVVKGSNAFGVEMYLWLAEREKGNIFFSPASIETALAMTYAGAKGETAKQMEKALKLTLTGERAHEEFQGWIGHLNRPLEVEEYREVGGQLKEVKVPAYELVVANALWGQKGYPFRPEFKGLVAKSYGGAMNEVDFGQGEAARGTINGWIEKQTKDRIKDMIGRGVLTGETRLVLTNAIYFKSDWAEKFKKEATKEGDFKVKAGKTVKAPLMYQVDHFGYGETADFQVLELPYKGNALSMVILLPRKVDGLAAVEKGLRAEDLEKTVWGLKAVKVKVTLPRWKFTSGLLSLNEALKGMGMKDAFEAKQADFSGMVTHEPLFISDVLHKAFVAVDEDGTEAAAATAVVMAAGSAMIPEEPKEFRADHPFVYVIRERASGGILFMGRVVDPSE
jgi:serpin B